MSTARSIGILTILNVLSAVVGLAQSVAVAFFFGTTRAIEIWFAAQGLLLSVQRLTQTGQLAEIFLPLYHRIKHDHGPEDAQRSFAALVNWMVLIVAGLCLVMWSLARPLVDLRVPGFTAIDRAVAEQMLVWLLPLLGLQVICSLVKTLAHAERWFGIPEAIGLAARGAGLATIIVLASDRAADRGAWVMVVALWVACGVQVVGLAVMLWRMGYRHRLVLRGRHFRVAWVFRKLSVTLGYVGATQVYAFVLDAMMSTLPQGIFAAFRYVRIYLFDKAMTILLRPIGVVFFTHVSEALARGARNVRDLARTALARTLGIATLAAVMIAVAGRSLLKGIWAFPDDTLEIATILMVVHFLLIFVAALEQVARKTTMSLGMVSRQYVSTGAVQLLSAVLAWSLIREPIGLFGLAATVSCNVILLAAAPMVILGIWRRDLAAFYPMDRAWRWALSAAAGWAAGTAMRWGLGPYWPMEGKVGAVLWSGSLAAVAAIVCAAAAWALGVYEVREVVRRLRSTRPEK